MTIRPLATPPARPGAVRPEAAAVAPRPALATSARPAAAPPSDAAPLSDAEREALGQQFPAAPDLALRLYGPRASSQPAQALGGHIDLRG
ncbi:hypothetical protein RQM47_11795 [Rubrivirga sp. S365]|uniref:Uncharacterized protein n=1 Tax=Rubrivirga litoralis TaxID=3075598 RepID=A0ABU3BSU1_9BACT|nr:MULTISPECIES: hypothetical protein [unclassified Rubrivirga]MDT0632358.1 hypothetical protein [Rubrivirga sp. F394]MDT7857324.1 hypothetical protein [Rubrivirga sp. S365]